MKVALVGGTGGMGAAILAELASRGHEVAAAVRRPGAIDTARYPGVTPVLADAYDLESLAKAFAGVDAVVSAFNPGWAEPDLYDKYLAGARTVVAATKNAGVARLLVVVGASSLYGPDGRELIESAEIPEPYWSGVRAARDHYVDDLRPERDLDWVALSPPLDCGPLGPTGRRGRYRVGGDEPVYDEDGVSAISVPDLALALVDELEVPRHHRQRFTVAY